MGGVNVSSRVWTLGVEYVFTYSCGAATKIRITDSAWRTLSMTGTHTYSRGASS